MRLESLNVDSEKSFDLQKYGVEVKIGAGRSTSNQVRRRLEEVVVAHFLLPSLAREVGPDFRLLT